jgi:HEAT repeats
VQLRAMAPRTSWLGGTQLAVAMVTIIVIVLCAILSLGRINNEYQYDGRSAAAWLVSSTDTSARTRATAAAALDYLWPVAGPLRTEIVRVEVSLLNDSYPEVRDEATAALAGMATESPDAVSAVVAVLVRSARLETRVQAAHVLGAAGPAASAAAPALVEATAASEASLRVAAVAALGDVGAGRDRAVIAALVRATDDQDENVRTVAMESMVDAHADAGMLVSLACRALRDPVASVREEAAYVLAASADTAWATRAALRDAVADSDSTVRHLVKRALARRLERTTRGSGVGSAR